MLQHAARLKQDQQEGGAAPPHPAGPGPPPEDLMAQLRLAASNLEAPRTRAAAGIFRPGHILPTRSLREQVRQESWWGQACTSWVLYACHLSAVTLPAAKLVQPAGFGLQGHPLFLGCRPT